MGEGFVGILTVDLHLPEATSLKQKRSQVRRVTQGLARSCGASVAEVDHHDLWQRCRLSLAVVSGGAGEVAATLERASRSLATDPEWVVIDEQREVLEVGEAMA